MDYDKMAINLTDSHRELLLNYKSCFSDHTVFRKISLAVKKENAYEVYLDDEELEYLMDKVSDLSSQEKNKDIISQLDNLNECLAEYYNDIFEDEDDDEDDYSEYSSNTGSVCVLKVSLAYTKKIWRKIAIREGQTLHDLHNIIFRAFDRYDEHMYSFFFPYFPKKRFNPRGIYDSSDEYTHPYACEDQGPFSSEGHNAAKTSIQSLNMTEGQVFYYLFDFGDEWWHEIMVEKINGKANDGQYPRITERKGQSPQQYPDPDEDW